MDTISLNKCIDCQKTLQEPVILPCGESICKKHTKPDDPNQTKFDCKSCEQTHEIPSGGFIPNKRLEQMINYQIKNSLFDTNLVEAKFNCTKLNEMLDELDLLHRDPKYYISESIGELKFKIEIKREEFKMKIDREAEKLIDEMKEYQDECYTNVESASYQPILSSYKTEAQTIRSKLVEFENELKKIEENASDLTSEKIRQDTEELILSIRDHAPKLKADLLLGDKFGDSNWKKEEFQKIDFNPIEIADRLLASEILTSTKMKQELIDLCQFSPNQKWRLLYRGSVDGFRASDFHRKCDAKSPTLTIIESNNGNVFGGYTESCWDQTNIWRRDPNAFLFSLINEKRKPIKLGIIFGKEHHAIASSERHGPGFGGGTEGHDIDIQDNSNVSRSTSNLGNSFKHPDFDIGSNEARSFLAGSETFWVNEIEVFLKIKADGQKITESSASAQIISPATSDDDTWDDDTSDDDTSSNDDITSNNDTSKNKKVEQASNKTVKMEKDQPAMSTSSLAATFAQPADILDMPVDPNEPIYCVCRQDFYGEMLPCDNLECPIEWFHFGCVGLATKPKGKWYCSSCTKKQKNI